MNRISIFAVGLGLVGLVSAAGIAARADSDFNQKFDNLIARKILEKRADCTNFRDFRCWEGLHTQNACRTAPAFKGELCGVQKMSHALQELIGAFPDYRLELLEVYRSKKDVFAKFRATGTFLKPLLLDGGVVVPPTGRSFSQEWVANIDLNQAGKIERFEEYYDQQDLLVQLGLVQ